MEKRENPVSMKYRFNAIHNSYSVFGTEHFKKFSVENSKVTLCTQMYKWEPANLTLGVTLQWTSITSRGRAEYSQTLHATEKRGKLRPDGPPCRPLPFVFCIN